MLVKSELLHLLLEAEAKKEGWTMRHTLYSELRTLYEATMDNPRTFRSLTRALSAMLASCSPTK